MDEPGDKMKLLISLLAAFALNSSAFAAPFWDVSSDLDEQQTVEEQQSEPEIEDSEEVEPADKTIPETERSCLLVDFKQAPWKSFANSNAFDYPVINKNKELELMPVTVYGGAAAYLFTNPENIQPPFEVTFDFSTFDDDGGYNRVWNSGDGIRFFFLRNISHYGQPLAGGSMGRSAAPGGYAISFPMYGSRQVRLDNHQGRPLKRVPFSRSYSHGEWVRISIMVREDGVTVTADNNKLFDYKTDWEQGRTGNAMGFSAATGAANSSHMIRNFCLRRL